MKSLIILTFIIAIVSANVHLNDKYAEVLEGRLLLTEELSREIYSDFVSRFSSKSEERYQIFKKNLAKICTHNAKKASWTMGINDFCDLTFDEIKELRLMAPQDCSATEHNLRVAKKVSIPADFEWNRFGIVTPVKNQGNCGSCWTFSTVAALEAHWNILGKGNNILFSEQQLVDCAGNFENYGCDGGLPSQAFEYIRSVQGIETEGTYPYTAKDGACVFKPQNAVGYAKYGSYNITEGDENQLAERLYVVGPISVAFEVIDDFSFYKSGVYSSADCGTTTKDVNHAVLATGYGVQDGKKYWNIKNSWGAGWGEKGYFKMERDVNLCAISMCNAYPLIDKAAMVGLEEVTI